MHRRDWVLVALAGAKEGTLTPVQIQKSLFLLAQKLPKDDGQSYYAFTAHHYGPCCVEIYPDAEELERQRLVDIVASKHGTWKEYKLTEAGKERAVVLQADLPEAMVSYVARVVEWTQSLTFTQLVKKIYALFPQYRTNSVFQG